VRRLLPLLTVVALLGASSGAVADRLVDQVHDEDAILVGLTGVDERAFNLPSAEVNGQTVGVSTTYNVSVPAEDNALQVRLSYDPGLVVSEPFCARVNDLGLEVENPRGRLLYRYAGCDDGEITVRDRNLASGEYRITVFSDQGTTACLPTAADGCSGTGVDYVFDAKVFQIE